MGLTTAIQVYARAIAQWGDAIGALMLREFTFRQGRASADAKSSGMGGCPFEFKNKVIRRHGDGLGERETGARSLGLDIGNIADAPIRVVPSQSGIEGGVARRRVLSVAHKRTVHEQSAVLLEETTGAGEQVLRDRPWRNVQDIDADDGEKLVGRTGQPRGPVGIEKIDAHWGAQVGELRICAPRGDAFEVLVIDVARPPRDVRRRLGESNRVLPGSAAELEAVAAAALQKRIQRRPDRRVIAMEGRRVESTISFWGPADLAEFDDVLRHGRNCSRAGDRDSSRVRDAAANRSPSSDSPPWRPCGRPAARRA